MYSRGFEHAKIVIVFDFQESSYSLKMNQSHNASRKKSLVPKSITLFILPVVSLICMQREQSSKLNLMQIL